MPAFFDTGFTVREPSWHGLETVLSDYPDDWDDARRAAGLMWEPRLVPLYTRRTETREFPLRYEAERWSAENGSVYGPNLATQAYTAERHTYEVDPNAQRVERDDNGASLGVVSGSFGLITHAQMGEIVDAVLGQTNVKFETAGSVKDGRQVYCLVRLDEPYTIPGDIDGNGDPVHTYPYLAILNSHDGTGAMKVLYTDVRVVCWNTVQAAAAQGDTHGAQVSLRHTARVADRLDDIVHVLRGSRANTERWQGIAAELASHRITTVQQVDFLDRFIPEPTANIVSDRVRNNIANDRTKFLYTLNTSPTNSAMSHTALGLFNAAVEFIDHERNYRSTDTYIKRTMLRPEPAKAKALTMVRDLVGANI